MSFLFGRDLEKWQETVIEEIIDPELEIFDPHFHLWNPVKEERGPATQLAKVVTNLSPKMKEVLYTTLFPSNITRSLSKYIYFTRKYETEDFMNEFKGHNVTKGIVVESGWRSKMQKGEENLENLKATKCHAKRLEVLEKEDSRFCFGVCAYINLTLDEDKILEAIEEHVQANPRVSSFRHALAWHKSSKIMPSADASKGLYKNKKFRAGLSILESKNIVFESWCFFTQLNEVKEIALEFPNLRIVLNHVGIPLGIGPYAGKIEEVKEMWKTGLEAMKDCDNITLKVSGLLMPYTGIGEFYKNKVAPTSDEVVSAILPYVETVINIFGTERCMFASNFPVDRCSVSYHVLFNAFKKCCKKLELSKTEVENIFFNTASQLYQI